MYAIYRELHPPTGVEHCIECKFLDANQSSLVVAATSMLRVYNVDNNVFKSTTSTTIRGHRLVQVAEYQLYGNIQSLNKVQLAHSNRESLLLCFKDAKLSLVEYDPAINDLKTTSLHFFEDDDLRGGVLNNIHRPYVRVDPEGRCAAMLIYGTHLAVLPLHHEALLEESEATTPMATSGVSHDNLSSYTVDLKSLSEKVTNVKDLQFVHGYNNPTVFILYEPTPTWAGRIALRKDTCSVIGISLNTSEHNNPVIWQSHNLPFDCCYCVPVPRPIGGILVFGANVLIYLNQSSPTVGFSVNSLAEKISSFKLRPTSLSISMDCSQAAFINGEQLVVSLRRGEIYVMTLVPEGMRGIRNILFEKTAAGVLASCICTVGSEHLFIGSRLGNSLLLKYTKKTWDNNDEVSTPPAAKRLKSEEIIGEDPDELEVYGSDVQSGPMLASYKFEVCDSVLNIGPIVDSTIGEPAFLSEEFTEQNDPDLELVTCSGHGKNGGLCVLQRNVRPQVVTTFELPGCSDMWTVHSISESQEVTEEHSFLILGQQESTMVLQTGQEITELDNSGFATQSPTVYAGNIGDGNYIVQVTCTDVRLLRGVNQLCRLPLDMGGGVRSCAITDPHIVVLLVDGSVALVELQEGTADNPAQLELKWPELAKGSKVVLTSAYTDQSGLFITQLESEINRTASAHSKNEAQLSSVAAEGNIDEDELLYGDVSRLTDRLIRKEEANIPMESDEPLSPLKQTTETESSPPAQHTHWCALYREDGSLEIYQVPNFTLVFCVRNFSSAPKTLMDSGPVALPSSHPGNLHSSEQKVDEVLLVGLGPQGTHTHLLALVDKELVIYKAFHHPQQKNPGHLHLRFSKVNHKVLLNDREVGSLTKQLSQPAEGTTDTAQDEELGSKFTPQLRVFTDIAGYSGVFVCGPYPHWLFMTGRGALQLHPMFVDGPVISFAPFHNVNCPRGFLYFNAEGELRISVLPSHLSYDALWPVRKVPTRCTTHFVSYHMQSKIHTVVTSEQVPLNEMPTGDDDNPFQSVERDDNFVLPMEDKFYLQLYSPNSWEAVPNAKYALDRFDRVVSMKVMRLRSQETASGLKEYIVLGVTSVCGEDYSCKGKILIFDVIEVIPEPGKPLTKHKLKCLYNEEQKGTISALEDVDGLILACMGNKIFMWKLKENKDLIGVAFIDTEIYIHKACAIKNFILIADINRSVQLLRYQENLRTLSQISKDKFPAEIYSCNFLIDGQQLGFVASDSDQNLILYQYQPELPDSNGGLYLTRRGEFNAGSHVNSFFHIQCKTSAPLGANSEVRALMNEKRHATFFATLDGGLGYLLPVAEKTYRRLLMLQTKLVQGLPHAAGLNPKAFRMFHTRHQYLYNPQRNVLDGELLWRYTQLSFKEKTDFAKQIGTTLSQIMADLKEIDKVAAHF